MILLNGHSLTPVGKIPIESMSLRLRERDSTAEITMAGGDLYGIAVNSWMQDDDGTVWRVRSIQHEYADSTIKIQLEHVVLALKDPILFGEIIPATITGDSSATTCTALQAINYILSQHSDWTLGTYGYGTITNAYKFDGDNLYDALERVCNTLDDPWWTLDTSVYPFRISIAPKQSGVACELRADRNLSAITRTVDMSGCYTRFYPIGKGDLHITGDYVSRNESTYGVIARVETDQALETEAELIAWANERLGKHAEPEVTVRAQGLDLAEATGEPLDQLTLGRICRVPLPEYNTTILDRITELYYPDLLRSPESVEITMANRTEDITRIIATEIKSGGGRSGSGGRRAARVEEKIQEFDNSDLWINRDAIWAVSGAYTVVTDELGNKHIRLKDGGLLEVMRDGVYETVGTSQAIAEVNNVVTNTILGSALWTQRDNITGVVGEFDVVGSGANRRLVVKSGGGLKVERNNVEYGIYDSGNLTAGILVSKLSDGTTTTKIKTDYLDISGIVTASAINTALANASILTSGEVTAGSVEATYGVSGATVTGDTVNVTTAMNFVGDSIDKQTITIDGVEQTAKFLGTAPLSFSIAGTAKYRAAVSAAGALAGAWSKLDPNDTYAPKYTVTSGTGEDREIIVSAVSPNGWEGISSGNPGTCTVYADAAGGHRAKYTVDGTLPYQQGLADGGGGGGDVVVSGSWNGKTYTAVNNKNSSSVSTTIVVAQGAWTSDWKKTISVSADGSVIDSSTVINGQSVYDTGARDVDFGSYTFSGDTHIVTTRTMYANISNGKSKGLENQLLLDYNSGNGQDGWFGSAPNYQKYVFWRTAPEGTTSWSSRMRGTISGRWVYNKGYDTGYDEGYSAGSSGSSVSKNDITVSDDSSAWGVSSQPNADVRTFALSGRTVNANGSWYRFKVTVKGITKTYCFKTVAS